MPGNKEDPATTARKMLEDAGYEVIIWSAADFPGATDEDKQNNFHDNIDAVLDICIERGNEAITDLCHDSMCEEEY